MRTPFLDYRPYVLYLKMGKSWVWDYITNVESWVRGDSSQRREQSDQTAQTRLTDKTSLGVRARVRIRQKTIE